MSRLIKKRVQQDIVVAVCLCPRKNAPAVVARRLHASLGVATRRCAWRPLFRLLFCIRVLCVFSVGVGRYNDHLSSSLRHFSSFGARCRSAAPRQIDRRLTSQTNTTVALSTTPSPPPHSDTHVTEDLLRPPTKDNAGNSFASSEEEEETVE